MGAYISQSDLDVYLSAADLEQLTDDAGAGAIDTGKVTECITAAEAEVNTYLATQYTTPITTTIPEPVKEWCVQLATLRLHLRRPPVPEDVWEMAKEARKQLTAVVKGTLSLSIGSDPPDEPEQLEPTFEFNERKLNRSGFSGW